MPNTDGNKSVNYKLLYSGTEEVYMMGLKVPLPEWAIYADSYDGIFMRFLKKNQPPHLAPDQSSAGIQPK